MNRARVEAMFDGANPYNQSQLNSSGQALKTNLNFGEAQRLLDISLSAYVDLYSSLEKLVEVKGTLGEPSEITPLEDIVAEELTHLMRSWPEFHSSYLRLCTTFIKHGVAFSYFDNPENKSAGEYVLMHPQGGAIALVSTTRLVSSGENTQLNTKFTDVLFEKADGKFHNHCMDMIDK